MSTTDFPHGVSSFGAVVVPNGSPANGKTHYWVQGNLGSDGYAGTSPDRPLRTMAAAMTKITSGDVIHFTGNITENITAPAGIFDITIIGEGTRPRHADAHTGNNGYTAATWKASSQSSALLTIRQQGWRLINILFDAPTSDAALDFIRDAASGDSERDSSHAEIIGCRFASGATGILVTGTENVFNVLVKNCIFNDLTDAIDSAGGYAHRWQIIDNDFNTNTNHIDVGFTQSLIKGNTFGKFTTMSVDLTGGANNTVYANYFSGNYDAAYVAGTNDEWAGNFSADITSDEVGGASSALNPLTTAVPVA